MTSWTVSQAAAHTGFTPSALRYYERCGLVRPARTPAGYRSYDARDLEALSFIGRAKRVGLTLDEITELLALVRGDRCAPVQDRLRDLVEGKVVAARAEAAERSSFAAELGRVAAGLDAHTPDGPCDDACGCTLDRPAEGDRPVVLGRQMPAASPAIACTLSGAAVDERLAEWQHAVAVATTREAIAGGTRLRFGTEVDLAGLAALLAAEHGCCSFFTFTLTVGPDGIALDVTAPVDARPMVDALVGAT
jgi:DNA-binding transcriptional MerR regulator